MLVVENIENSTMHNMQELHLSSFLLSIFTSLTVSVHSSTNLSTYLFLHLYIHQRHMIYHIHTHN